MELYFYSHAHPHDAVRHWTQWLQRNRETSFQDIFRFWNWLLHTSILSQCWFQFEVIFTTCLYLAVSTWWQRQVTYSDDEILFTYYDNMNTGEPKSRKTGRPLARANKFCTVWSNTCVWSVRNCICHPSDAWNFEVTPRLVKNLCTPELRKMTRCRVQRRRFIGLQEFC
jgi:hypothetical protein